MVGRKRLYDNDETRFLMQKLIYEARKDNVNGKTTGILRNADMVRYSEYKHNEYPEEYPVAYNKEAWSTWGKTFIDRANTLPTKKIKLNQRIIEIPNFTKVVSKHKGDEGSLLKHLLPVERLLNSLLEELHEVNAKQQILKEENNRLNSIVNKYKRLTLTMAHEGTLKYYREKFGIKNILSPKENPESLQNLDQLDKFINTKTESESLPKGKEDDTTVKNEDSVIGNKISSIRRNK